MAKPSIKDRIQAAIQALKGNPTKSQVAAPTTETPSTGQPSTEPEEEYHSGPLGASDHDLKAAQKLSEGWAARNPETTLAIRNLTHKLAQAIRPDDRKTSLPSAEMVISEEHSPGWLSPPLEAASHWSKDYAFGPDWRYHVGPTTPEEAMHDKVQGMRDTLNMAKASQEIRDLHQGLQAAGVEKPKNGFESYAPYLQSAYGTDLELPDQNKDAPIWRQPEGMSTEESSKLKPKR